MPHAARWLLVLVLGLAGPAAAQVESIERGWRDEEWTARERVSAEAIEGWAGWTDADLARFEALGADPDSEVADRARKALARIRIRRQLGPALVRRGLDEDLLGGETGGIAALAKAADAWWVGDLVEGDLAGLVAWGARRPWPGSAGKVVELAKSYPVLYEDLLRAFLAHPEARIREAAIAAFEQGAACRLRGDEVVPLLADPSGRVRGGAVALLARVDREALRARIEPLVADRDPWVVQKLEGVLRHGADTQLAERLLPLLLSPDPARRGGAAALLGESRIEEHAPAVRPLLEDPEPGVRSGAARALAKLGDRAALDGLARLVRDPDEGVRCAAIDALERLRARDREAEIASALDDPDPEVRSSAALALGRMEARSHAARIATLLDHPEPLVRADAAVALGWLGTSEHSGALAEGLADPDPSVQVSCAGALLACGDLAHLSRIVAVWRESPAGHHAELPLYLRDSDRDRALPLLQHEDPHVRIWVVSELSRLDAREHAGAIAKLLDDSDAGARAEAASALGRFRAREHRGRIAALLEDPECRWSALEALQQLRARDQIPRIAPLLGSGDPDERRMAVEALGRLAARDHLPAIEALARDPHPRVRDEAIRVLRAYEPARSVAAWVALLGDPSERVRRDALYSLGALEAREHAGAIAAALGDPSKDVRSAAIESLVRLRAVERVPEIRALLEDPEPYLRIRALGAIAILDPDRAREPALAALRERGVAERAKALEVLTGFARPEDVPLLLPLLAAGCPDLRRLSAAALAATGARDSAGALLPLLEDALYEVRQAAAASLRALEYEGRAEALGRLAASANPDVCRFAVLELAAEGPDEAARIAAFLRDESGVVVSTACSVLAQIGARDLVPEIERLIEDPRPDVRCGAAWALRTLDDRRFVLHLPRFLADPAEGVREVAARNAALAPASVARLLALLDDESQRVRAAAIRSLGVLGAREQADRIAALATPDAAPIVQGAVAAALRDLGARAQAPSILGVVECGWGPAVEEGAESLADLGESRAVPVLREMVLGRDREKCRLVMAALVRLEGSASVDLLLELLYDGEVSSLAALRLAEASAGLPEERRSRVVAGLEEVALYPSSRAAASIALLRLGREGPVPARALLEEAPLLDELADALCQRHGPDAWAAYAGEVELERSVRSAEDLARFFAARGLALEGVESLAHVQLSGAGIRISPRGALARCGDARGRAPVAVLEGKVVRVVPREAVAEWWRERLGLR